MSIDGQTNYSLPSLGSNVSGYGFVELNTGDLCRLDDLTIKSLELLENNIDRSNRKHSLYGFLNSYTSTTIGSRLLNEAITRPLCHLQTIEHRLDCIEYLSKRVDTLAIISNSIRKYGQNIDLNGLMVNLENLCKTRNDTLYVAEKRMDAISTIEVLLSQVQVIIDALSGTEQPTLNIFKIALDDPTYGEMLGEIYSFLEPDVRTTRGKRSKVFRIKTGVESLFDLARSTYFTAINDMEAYVQDLNKDDKLPWKLSYTETRGYFLTLSLDRCQRKITLGPTYIRVNRTRSTLTCTTKELMQLNVRSNMSYENSMKLANEILVSAISTITSHMSEINKLIDIVGMLDLITSFAKMVNESNGSMVRPKFNATDTIVTGSRHPVLESMLKLNQVPMVPNDYKFSTRNGNFMLVTGPNMGGKSVFLRQVALIQIMAQIGCYVPAESAHIKLMNRIVCRSGTSDDNFSSCSSFMWEMRGIASALRQDQESLNESVLFVIDEIGRGTSIDYGASYSFAIAEELSLRKQCFTVFATHFEQVFALTSLYNHVKAYSFKYEEGEDTKGQKKLRINHFLVPGIGERVHYGIKLAEASGFPQQILRLACKDSNLHL